MVILEDAGGALLLPVILHEPNKHLARQSDVFCRRGNAGVTVIRVLPPSTVSSERFRQPQYLLRVFSQIGNKDVGHSAIHSGRRLRLLSKTGEPESRLTGDYAVLFNM